MSSRIRVSVKLEYNRSNTRNKYTSLLQYNSILYCTISGILVKFTVKLVYPLPWLYLIYFHVPSLAMEWATKEKTVLHLPSFPLPCGQIWGITISKLNCFGFFFIHVCLQVLYCIFKWKTVKPCTVHKR